jgi:hypothetical protein
METTFGGPVVFGRPTRSKGIGFWRSPEKHLWCAACTRTYPNGIYRSLAGRKTCPYVDCEGDADAKSCGWSLVKRQRPDYPITPWMAIQYPFDGTARAATVAAPMSTPQGAFDRTAIFRGD